MEVGEEFHTMGIEAQKAGVDVGWLDRIASVAKTANIGVDQLGNAFKLLEQNAVAATDGDKKASESFNKLGISSEELSKLLQKPQELFERVRTSIGNMTGEAERLSAAHNVMGRSAAQLIPIFAMSEQQFDKLSETFDRLNGGMDAHTAQMGASLDLLENYFSNAFEGIQRAAAKPVLEYLSNHIDEIEPKIEAVTDAIKDGLVGAWDLLSDAADALKPALDPVEDQLGNIGPVVMKLGTAFGDAASLITDQFSPAIDGLGPAFGPVMAAINPLLGGLGQLKDSLEEVIFLLNKQREISGLNEDTKASLKGLVEEEALLSKRIVLSKEATKAIKELQETENADLHKYDFKGALKTEGKIVDQMRGNVSEQGQLQSTIDQVEKLGWVPLSKGQMHEFQHMANITHEDINKGDIHGAFLNESRLLEQLQSLADDTQRAGVSMNMLNPAIDALADHIHKITSAFAGPPNVMGGGSGGEVATSFTGGSGGAAGGATNATYQIHVAAPDPKESAMQVASRLLPSIRKMHDQYRSDTAGMAMMAAAELSMGGSA
jgi:hypothetical protein